MRSMACLAFCQKSETFVICDGSWAVQLGFKLLEN